MKLQKTILVLIILFVSFPICFGQEKQEKLNLFDSTTEPHCEHLLNRLDYFVIETSKNPAAVGYIVIQSGANPIKNKFYEQYIKFYIKSRKIEENRFSMILAKPVDKLKVDFWISSDANLKPNFDLQDFTYKLPTDKSILFVQDTIEVAKIDGKLFFFGDCAACCIETINLNLLSAFLQANPQLNANMKIYNNSRKRAKQLEKLIRNEAVNDHKIPAARLKFSYGGKDQGIEQFPNNISSIIVELVPVK